MLEAVFYLCPSLDFGIYSSVQVLFVNKTLVFNEEIALCSSHAGGSIGYRKVQCSAHSFDVVVKGCFDGDEIYVS
jgi:hypothetical protein